MKIFFGKDIFSVVWLCSGKHAGKWFPVFGLHVKWLSKNMYNSANMSDGVSAGASLSLSVWVAGVRCKMVEGKIKVQNNLHSHPLYFTVKTQTTCQV